jgi:hypothetical protein
MLPSGVSTTPIQHIPKTDGEKKFSNATKIAIQFPQHMHLAFLLPLIYKISCGYFVTAYFARADTADHNSVRKLLI